MIFSKELNNRVLAYIEENRSEALAFLEALVNLEGQHGEKECLMKTAEFLRDNFEKIGLKTELLDAGDENGPVVTGVLNDDIDEKEVTFTGHYDTVFAAGSRGENPFYIEDGKAYGPGVCDMKGGITIAFFTVKALKEFGFRDCPVRLLFVGDEEVNHPGGKAIEYMKEYTKDTLVAFNMENRYESGEVCIGRKGCCEYTVNVHGVASHPGHAYDDGRNAIEEMAYKVIGLQQCTPKQKDRDFSVNVGTIHGGTVCNGVPAFCQARLDIRVKSMKALEECDQKMKKVCEETHIEGTSTELILDNILPPFETTNQVQSAFETLKSISDAVGGNITGSIVVGGASDAAYIAPQGTKIVCQCGIIGAYTHNEREYAVVESLYEGIRLFVHTVYNYNLFKN